MQEARKKTPPVPTANGAIVHEESERNRNVAGEFVPAVEEQVVEPYAKPGLPQKQRPESADLPDAHLSEDFENFTAADLEIPPPTILEDQDNVEAPATTALAKPERPAAWSSAATARDFFEQLAAARNPGAWAKLWNARRGDIYLVVAVILVLGVIGWGIRSRHSVGATGNPTVSAARRKAAPDLPLFDRILVKLGLAEAPDPPQYRGNPRTQVWVDLQTALYYCPGTDLYGKTPKGRFSSQRDAQLDQFEPAYRKACD
jgi:hypothetical protein